MTRKDFVLKGVLVRDSVIADILLSSRPTEANTNSAFNVWDRIDQWNLTVHGFAQNLQAANPRFDRIRFLKACGYND